MRRARSFATCDASDAGGRDSRSPRARPPGAQQKRSRPISRVLLRHAENPRAMTVIPLGPSLPTGSSRLPADSASSVVVRLLGVAPDGGCRVSPASRRKRLVSVALFLAFAAARAAATAAGRYPASRSAEPGLSSPPGTHSRGSDDLAGFAGLIIGATRDGKGPPARWMADAAQCDFRAVTFAGETASPVRRTPRRHAPTRQRSSSPARSGTMAPSPNGSVSGTRQVSRINVIESVFCGNR